MRQVSSAIVKAMVRYSTSALEPFSTFLMQDIIYYLIFVIIYFFKICYFRFKLFISLILGVFNTFYVKFGSCYN